MSKPRVAIITRTMNRELLLERALESVLEQDYTDWVLVVVNSGESKPVADLLAKHAEALAGRVQTVSLEGPGPIGRASNTGIDASDSEFVTLLDDDDTWDPTYLSKMVTAMDTRLEPEVRGVVCRSLRVDERPEGDGIVRTGDKEFNPTLVSLKLFQLASVNQFTVNAFLYERAAFVEVGSYREDLPVLDDWDFNLRFLRQFDIDVVPETLANYHVRPAETVGVSANTLTSGEQLHKFYEARIANQHLREDLERGEIGFGFLMNMAAGHRSSTDILKECLRKTRSVSRKVGRIDSRTKQIKDRGRNKD